MSSYKGLRVGYEMSIPFYFRADVRISSSRVYFIPNYLILVLLTWICPAFANCVDLDQLASESALFVSKYVTFYQQPGSSNLIGLKLDKG